MPTNPTIMKMRLSNITKTVSGIPTWPDVRHMEEWEAWFERGKSEVAGLIRQELNNLPKGYNPEKPSLKEQGKRRFLQWRENQAQAEWKNLPAVEQERWEAYVSEGAEFGEIRERELQREALGWEYGVEQTNVLNGEKSLVGGILRWTKKELAKDRCQMYVDQNYVDGEGKPVYTYKVVRREKPKDYEEVAD